MTGQNPPAVDWLLRSREPAIRGMARRDLLGERDPTDLHLLVRMGRARDERAADALDLFERRRLPDGRWEAGGYWWLPPGSARSVEVVDWRRRAPNEMITLNALRILRAAGRA